MKLALAILLCGTFATGKDLQVIQTLDIQKYLGTWYEIARFPAPFQKDCVAVTAEYSLREDKDIQVRNTCRLNHLDGRFKESTGKAWVVDAKEPAKLKVRFFWPFSGDYWVIDLGENYEYAVVSEPKKKYLWILSRTPQLPEPTLKGILERLKEREFDLSRLSMTPQPIGNSTIRSSGTR